MRKEQEQNEKRIEMIRLQKQMKFGLQKRTLNKSEQTKHTKQWS